MESIFFPGLMPTAKHDIFRVAFLGQTQDSQTFVNNQKVFFTRLLFLSLLFCIPAEEKVYEEITLGKVLSSPPVLLSFLFITNSTVDIGSHSFLAYRFYRPT